MVLKLGESYKTSSCTKQNYFDDLRGAGLSEGFLWTERSQHLDLAVSASVGLTQARHNYTAHYHNMSATRVTTP